MQQRYEAVGVSKGEAWRPVEEQPVITGLRWESERLRARISKRVDQMYDSGLLKETEGLVEKGLNHSPTARQALGYQEAMRCLDGEMTEPEARERTVTRTWQLAKRQMTWFRHQAHVDWIDVDDAMSTDGVAEKVMHSWRKYGPAEIPGWPVRVETSTTCSRHARTFEATRGGGAPRCRVRFG